MPYRTKKRLGQNFLTSDSIIDRIVEQLSISENDQIVEIGPGRGAITSRLINSNSRVTAVEFDRDLIPYLKKLFEKESNLEIINEDILKFEPLFDKFKLIGNLPYNITSPVIDWIVRNHQQIDVAVLMVQKEMALRVASQPGNKEWSPIAIFTQLYFDISICFDISPKHFRPAPKVTSSVIKLLPKKVPKINNFQLFEKIIRTAFKQRRKLLINNLVPELISDKNTGEELFGILQLPENIRAEELSTEKFLKLTDLINSRNITK